MATMLSNRAMLPAVTCTAILVVWRDGRKFIFKIKIQLFSYVASIKMVVIIRGFCHGGIAVLGKPVTEVE